MTSVFADTSFYQALLNPRDRWHNVALECSKRHNGNAIASEYVLCELWALMARGQLRPLFVDLVNALISDGHVDIVPATHELFGAAFELFSNRPDKDWSLTDCASFLIMKERGIDDAFASDRHFEQAGFRVLLTEE